MIIKTVNPQTREVTFAYPKYLKKEPITVSIQSSHHASILHDIYQKKYITSEINKFINTRSKAYATHMAFTPERLRAIEVLRGLVYNHQEGKLLGLCIQIVRNRHYFEVLAPRVNSPKRAYYDLSIQNIIDNVTEIAQRRAPYCIAIAVTSS